ncbi:hypothetical protein ACI784_09105 [Geodermatophilus sp. SYSU D01186]
MATAAWAGAILLAGCGGDAAAEAGSDAAAPTSSNIAPTPRTSSSAPSPTPSATPTRTPAGPAITIAETGWSYDSEFDTVSWGAVLGNDGTDWELIEVSATAVDATGFALGTGQVTVHRLPTGQMAVGGGITDAVGVTDVQVTISDPGVSYLANYPAETGTVTATTQIRGGVGFDAQVSATFTSTLAWDVKSGNQYHLLFRNGQGGIVGGAGGYLPAGIPAGGQATMSLSDWLLVPTGTMTVETYVDVFRGF